MADFGSAVFGIDHFGPDGHFVGRFITLRWDLKNKSKPFVPQQPSLVEIGQSPQTPTKTEFDNRG